MGSDLDDPVTGLNEESDVGAPEDAVDDSQPNKRKRGKVPKKIMKAERERLKREQLNELFNKLAGVLVLAELSQENNGKASILNETMRLMKDMLSHIQSLRKENATLLSESNYMTVEKNELKEETTALAVNVRKLQNELEEKISQSKPDLNVSPSECWHPNMASHFMEGGHLPQMPTSNPSSQQQPFLGPLYVIPMNPDLQAFQKSDAAPNPAITVSKPHARYPTSADSWPLELLSKQTETTIRQTS